jgi:hypothetical protein
MMSSTRKLGRQALAEFFSGFVPQRAHWYSIVVPAKEGVIDDRIAYAFPPLSKLASLREGMMQALLLHCRLLQFRKNFGSCRVRARVVELENGIPVDGI